MLIQAKYYTKNKLTLWLNGEQWLGLNIGVWRIIWGNPDRIILEADLPAGIKIFELPKGCTLEILHKPAGRFDNREGAEVILRFNNCQPHRKWIPQPMALYAEDSILTAFVELTCEIENLINGRSNSTP